MFKWKKENKKGKRLRYTDSGLILYMRLINEMKRSGDRKMTADRQKDNLLPLLTVVIRSREQILIQILSI